jgi:antitoxin (DNA-binding transcriptional repressor) of toxin-antitoxin stability system
MKVATVADLRNRFALVSKWIESGEKVKIKKRGEVFATLSPARKKKKKQPEWPDLMARLLKNFPNPSPGKPCSELISEGRGDR